MKLSPLPLSGLVLTVAPLLSKPASKNSSDSSKSTIPPEPAINLQKTPGKSQGVKKRQQGVWRVFGSTFLTIFLAEMGDKTQLATLLMSAQSQSPWVVFAGAAAALVATSLLGVLIGRWLATRLSPKTLETAAGGLLLFISVLLLWDVVSF